VTVSVTGKMCLFVCDCQMCTMHPVLLQIVMLIIIVTITLTLTLPEL